MTPTTLWPGRPSPLGASVNAEGVNFALFSENATGVDLCLFDHAEAPAETLRVRMLECTHHVWHCFVPGLKAGQLYGFRVHGPYEPSKGHRFNSAKLLLDPYAKAITSPINWSPEMFGYALNGGAEADLVRDDQDNAWCMPKGIVIEDDFDWEGDRLPYIAPSETVMYEVHVKGFSKTCPSIPEEIRGTYAALGHDFSIEYFKKLGVTAIELLPVHQFVNDQFLEEKGLTNYWGYNTYGFFAPHSAYAQPSGVGGQVREFKEMVKRLHAAGLEVILDVVYNHTGEGNHFGPTLNFKGIDNAAYYRLVHSDRRFYMDYTGTGNTLNTQHPQVLQLVMDSLRYWVEEMHVDGFRFDLASTLGRESHEVTRLAAFFDCVHQDPVIAQVKLIAEPWDLGEGGYQVGNFPTLWSEWNGKYRDCLRSFWKGDIGLAGELAYRLTGSADLYEGDGRRPYASVNLLTAHDGFTLYDVVSYNDKHNEANGENNMDGHNDNRSWNCGAEGPTDEEEVNILRRRQMRNFLTSLLLSQGVPMIAAGDEFGRTQSGNNNAYCQDNEISWFNWEREAWQDQLLQFTSDLIKLRRAHPVFRRPKYFQGRRVAGSALKDLMWFDTDGSEMTEEDWNSGHSRCLGMLLSGASFDVRDAKGEPVRDDTFLLLLNAHHEPVSFCLPGREEVNWAPLLDTQFESGRPDEPQNASAGDAISIKERSLILLQLVKGTQDEALNVSWRHQQKGSAAAPPLPPRISRHEPVDLTVARPPFREKKRHVPTTSELAQGVDDPPEPPTK